MQKPSDPPLVHPDSLGATIDAKIAKHGRRNVYGTAGGVQFLPLIQSVFALFINYSIDPHAPMLAALIVESK
jgi:hypothetical protein